jgi:hypothetical protein
MIGPLRRRNKLRTFTIAASVLLLVFAVWGTFRYGNGHLFAVVALFGVGMVAIPWGLSHGKLRFAHWRQRRRDSPGGRDAGAIYVSEEAVPDREEALSAISSALADTEYGPERDTFSTGPGLTVRHTGFHNSFVQLSDGGRLVVTGEGTRTEPLVRIVESACGVEFDRSSSNPLLERTPIEKGPRVFLSIFMIVFLIGGILVGLNAAYPSSAYNSAERSVFVLMDGRGDLDPTTSEVETTLDKAAFTVAILEEERTEVRWLGNDTDRIMTQARDSLVISGDARALLSSLENRSLTDAEAARAERIRSDLREAEREMADTLDETVENGTVSDPERVAELRRIGARLRDPADVSTGQ